MSVKISESWHDGNLDLMDAWVKEWLLYDQTSQSTFKDNSRILRVQWMHVALVPPQSLLHSHQT